MEAREVQLEWIFLQHLMKYMEQAFSGMNKFLQETFFPHIFLRRLKTLSQILGPLSMFPVMKYGLVLQNPVTSAKDK